MAEFGEVTLSLLKGFAQNCQIFLYTLIAALPLGLIITFGSMAKFRPIKYLARAFVWIIRGTPLMLQLFIVMYVPGIVFDVRMPSQILGIDQRLFCALIAFIINYAAYFSEIFRGGIESIPKGQYEAAKMLKLSSFQTIRYIILPQVVKIVLPSIFNEIINLVKDSSLVYVLGVGDLLLESRTAANRDATLAPMFVAGAIYLILVGVVTVASKNIEKKFNYYK